MEVQKNLAVTMLIGTYSAEHGGYLYPNQYVEVKEKTAERWIKWAIAKPFINDDGEPVEFNTKVPISETEDPTETDDVVEQMKKYLSYQKKAIVVEIANNHGIETNGKTKEQLISELEELDNVDYKRD